MADNLKHIKMGPSSPDIGLPSPVKWSKEEDPSILDGKSLDSSSISSGSLTLTSVEESDDGSTSDMPVPTPVDDEGISVVSSTTSSFSMPENPDDDDDNDEDAAAPTSNPRPEGPDAIRDEIRRIVAEVMEELHKQHVPPPAPLLDDNSSSSSSSDSSDDSSYGFYWKGASTTTQLDYSQALDKAVRRKSERVFDVLSTLAIADEAVKIAVKEIIATEEDLSAILKRMHNHMRDPAAAAIHTAPAADEAAEEQQQEKEEEEEEAPRAPPTWEHYANPSFYSSQASDVRRLLREHPEKGYMLKHGGELYMLDVPEFLRVDAERAKLDALIQVLRTPAQAYDDRYKYIRWMFRQAVHTGKYAFQEDDGFKPVLPRAWVASVLPPSSEGLFNAAAFVQDCKIGPMEEAPFYPSQNEQQQDFIGALRGFVADRQQGVNEISRQCMFDLKRTDDVLGRFLACHESNDNGSVDLTLLISKLSVLLSNSCVLLRLHINYAYPNLAVWLQAIESLEHEHELRVLAPFFPPVDFGQLQTQVTNMGIFDSGFIKHLTVYHKGDAPPTEPSGGGGAPRSKDEELRFSTSFMRLFSRSE